MPHFHFHVREGDRLIEEPEGNYLPDLQTTPADALAAAREGVAEHALAPSATWRRTPP